MITKDPILIAGAGPTGLALALWLYKLDPSIPVKIISKASRPGTTSRAIVVHARTIELYRQVGIADKLIEESEVLDKVSILKYGVKKGTLSFGQVGLGQSPYPFVLSTRQDLHEQILLDYLKAVGVNVAWEHELQDIEQFSDHVLVTINGVQQRFSYVAGCDGASSKVRNCCQLQMNGGLYAQRFFVADVKVAPGTIRSGINVAPAEKIFVVFLKYAEEGHCRMIGEFTPPDHVKDPSFEYIRGEVEDAAALNVEKVEWFSVYRVRHSVVEKFRDRRVFLVGDAAHQHSPVFGQGMNNGIGDAFNLGWKLASVYTGSGPEELLDTYHTEREASAQALVNTTDRIFTLLTDTGWMGWIMRCIFIPYIVPLIWKIPPARKKYFQVVSQIGLEYKNSVLNETEQQPSSRHAYAGQRLPWLCTEAYDTHDPFSTPQWHIVRFVKEFSGRAESTILKGIQVRTHQYTEEAGMKGFVDGKVYIIRPDGFIGLVANGLDDARLDNYIERWGIGCVPHPS